MEMSSDGQITPEVRVALPPILTTPPRSPRRGGVQRGRPARPFPTPLAVGFVVYFAALLWTPRILDRLHPLTGDEPFYVMTAISLIDDGDLNEANNYAQRDFDRFYPIAGLPTDGWAGAPYPLPPHQSQTTRPGLYSKHGLGMAVLVAVPFALGGRALVLVLLATIAGALAGQTTALAGRYALPRLAAGVGLALAFTNPLASYSLLIFPEMTAALAITYAVRRVLAPRNVGWQWFLTGGATAVLPWLHYRLAPVCVVLAVLALLRHRRALRGRAGLVALALPLPSAVALGRWYWYLYGSILPPSSDHRGFSNLGGTLNGLAGTFLDQQWGAAVHNPLLLLAVAAFAPFVVWQRRDALSLTAVALPYLLLIAAYHDWWGEWGPPARYLADIVPLAAAPLGWWLARLRGWRPWAVLGVAVLPGLLVMATFVTDPQRMYNDFDNTSPLSDTWERWTGLPLAGLVPSFVFYNAASTTERVIVSLGVLAAVGLLAWVCLRTARVDREAARGSQPERLGPTIIPPS